MKIAIAGAGKLGMSLAEALLGGGHKITLIDSDEELLRQAGDRLDLYTAAANVKERGALKDLRVDGCDIFISCVESDELNMIACRFAKDLGCPAAIARVRAPEHVDQMHDLMRCFGIDHIVNPDLACAEEISKYLTQKYSLKGGGFIVEGAAVQEVSADAVPQIRGMEIRNAAKLLDGLLIGAISRDGKISIPSGCTIIEEGDLLYVIGLRGKVAALAEKLSSQEGRPQLRRAMIAGGGKTGYFLARLLLDKGIAVKIIERDKERCAYLSQNLEKAMVLCGDATDMALLQDENLDGMDAFIAATGYDEENLLVSLSAKKRGVRDVVTRISRRNYDSITDALGVSMIVNPVDICTADVLRYIKGGSGGEFFRIIQGQAAFSDIQVKKGMRIAEASLSELEIPKGVLIAAVCRGRDVLIPNGRTVIEPGDRVITLSMLSSASALESLFSL